MERAFGNQKWIEVSLPRVYNCSLVLKTEERSLSKAMSATTVPTPTTCQIDVKIGTMGLDGSPCLIRNYLWSKFQQSEKRPRLPEIPLKRPHVLDAASNTKRFENL